MTARTGAADGTDVPDASAEAGKRPAGRDILVYVINVDAHVQRWQAIRSRARELGMELIRWPATTGAEIAPVLAAGGVLDDGIRVRDFPPHSANAAACAVSHIRLLRAVVSSGARWTAILEDDAVPLRPVLAERELRLPADADIVLLTERCAIGSVEISAGPYSYGKVIGGAGTEGYLVSNRGARKLLRVFDPLKDPVDYQMYSHFASVQANDGPPFFWRLPRNPEADDVELTAYRVQPPLIANADVESVCGGQVHPRARFYSRVLLGIGFHGECLR